MMLYSNFETLQSGMYVLYVKLLSPTNGESKVMKVFLIDYQINRARKSNRLAKGQKTIMINIPRTNLP